MASIHITVDFLKDKINTQNIKGIVEIFIFRKNAASWQYEKSEQ